MAGAVQTLTFEQLAQWAEQQDGVLRQRSYRPVLEVLAVMLTADLKTNFEAGHAPDGTAWPALAHPRPRTGGADQPLRDRGLLLASLTAGGAHHVQEISDAALVVGTNLDYARLQQEGGEVRPTSAKALAIPLTAEAARVGCARDWTGPPLFVFRATKGQHAFLAEAQQKGGRKSFTQLVLHYILVASVKVPARPFLGFSKSFIGLALRAVGDFVARRLGGGDASQGKAA
jgi:phage gpG-like protein